MLGEIVEAVRGAVGEVDGFMRECGEVRECDLADASLVLEARVAVPDSIEEAGEVVMGAVLLLAPTLDGEGFEAVLRWLAGRATVKHVAGEGAEVALGLESPGIGRALTVLEQVALKLASVLGPGVLVELAGVLGDDKRPLWSLSIQVCSDASGDPGEAAEHGAAAALRIIRALGIQPGATEREDLEPVGSASTPPREPPEVCAGVRIRLTPRT